MLSGLYSGDLFGHTHSKLKYLSFQEFHNACFSKKNLALTFYS